MSLSLGAGLAISAAASLLGGGMSSLGAAQANKRGVKLAREQMKWQEEQTDKSRKWNEDIYNRYQSANAQAAQYRAAGLNPQLTDVQTGSVGNVDTPQGVQMPEQQNELMGIGNSVTSAINSGSQLVSTSSQKSLNESLEIVNKASAQLLEAQKSLTEQSERESVQRVERMKKDLDLLVATFDDQVNSAYLDNVLKKWKTFDLEQDVRSKLYSYYNILPAQQDVYQKQAIMFSASAFKAIADGRLTLKDLEYYAKNFATRQTMAQASYRQSSAALMNAKTAELLGQHQSGLLDAQSGEVKRRNSAFDLPLMHNGKLTKAGHALQYLNYNMVKSTLHNSIMQPEMMRNIMDMNESISYRNYVGGTADGATGIMGLLQDYNMLNSDSEVRTTSESYKYDPVGNRIYTGGRETYSQGKKRTTSRKGKSTNKSTKSRK